MRGEYETLFFRNLNTWSYSGEKQTLPKKYLVQNHILASNYGYPLWRDFDEKGRHSRGNLKTGKIK